MRRSTVEFEWPICLTQRNRFLFIQKCTKVCKNKNFLEKNILISPLDWGLGHATRIIPLVTALSQKGCNVTMATSGAGLLLLQQAFPNMRFVEIPGYGIEYSGRNNFLKILSQTPGILKIAKNENLWLKNFLMHNQVDAIISDNRYGFYHPEIPSVILTHQVEPQLPRGLQMLRKAIQMQFAAMLNHFHSIWIPDLPDEAVSLGGKLSRVNRFVKRPHFYTGWLTRFEHAAMREQKALYDLVLLSGPEPQRTLLEEKILQQVDQLNFPLVIIRGLPGEKNLPAVSGDLIMFNHLASGEMDSMIQNARYIISRGGYSTLMDMAALQKKCIYIPTPGQTEQEYLAKRMQEQGRGIWFRQPAFDLKHALTAAQTFEFRIPAFKNNALLLQTVDSFLQELKG